MTTETQIHVGLDGVVAAATRLSSVDGKAGELIIAGFPLEDFAAKATFEETLYLLWHAALPDAEQLAELRAALAEQRALAPITLAVIQAAAERQADVMDVLRMATSTLVAATDRQAALLLVAQMPSIVAAYWRTLKGEALVAPRPDLDHAANYLWMLSGAEPAAAQVRALETYLNTVVDHGLNASTFTARVIISTESDLVSAIVGAIGALKGPLHGGAPGPALDMVFEIGSADRAEAVLREKLDRGERLMGFGHRVYKVRDPRAEVLAQAAQELFATAGDRSLYELVTHVERTAVALLAERKPGRNLQTNVEFYTALLLHGLGLPTELFTPTFTISRVGGWIAHAFEQQEVGRIIRPQSVYTGVKNRVWEDVSERSAASVA
ncbi:MAG: citrate synthase/methylcitrate synthase [Herpetosiphonaceae bacterium]|nr:citrate synthase/methylcitrate synthase [Herpetosiphonaceae bacterium]